MSPKLQPKFDGPFLITETLGVVVVRIRKSPRHKPKVVHTNLLKAIHGEVDRSWLSHDTEASSAGTTPEAPENPPLMSANVDDSEPDKGEEAGESTDDPGEEDEPVKHYIQSISAIYSPGKSLQDEFKIA